MAALILGFLGVASCSKLEEGDPAPGIVLKTDEGKEFDLNSRLGKWTVLYFYPKADTPGCTKQACAFRDGLSHIRQLNADIFGVSTDTVQALRKFKEKNNINFVLVSDPDLKAVNAYGTKMPLLKISRRWTFIIDPELRIRSIDKNVDPISDAKRVAETLRILQSDN